MNKYKDGKITFMNAYYAPDTILGVPYDLS